MSNYDITELGWENGQPSKHEHVGILPTSKTTWGTADDTLESIVHQATCLNINLPEFDHYLTQHHHLNNKNSVVTSTSKYGEYSKIELDPPLYTKKRVQSSEHSDQCGVNDLSSSQQEQADKRSCTGMNNLSSSHQEQANKRLGVSANAANCRDNDTIMMTLASLESPTSLKTKPGDEDSGCHAGSDNQDDEPENKGEMVRSRSSKRSRVAALHNQSERKRRDRINQKMKTLQKLVPNANKTDKASMLDEVIEHLKQLQAQVEMMSTRNIPQMMMPPGMQQQLQMSHLARMGMSAGLGMNMGPMLDMRTASQQLSSLVNPNYAKTAATPTYIPPQFMVPPMIPRQMYPQASTLQGATNLNSVPFGDPYSVFPPQSMNMELYNKMVEAVYQQQVNQAAQTTNGSNSKSKHVQGE